MNFGLRVQPLADDDVDELADYILEDSVDQALRFYDAVNATYKSILQSPESSPIYYVPLPRLNKLRKKAVKGFENYLVFYRVDADIVEIVRVLHGARDIPAVFKAMDS